MCRPVKEVGRHLTHVDPLRTVHVLVDDRCSGDWRRDDWRAASSATGPASQFLSAGILCLAVGDGLHDVGCRLFGQPCVDVVWGEFVGYDDVRDV